MLHDFIFGIYPYIALSIFFIASLIRFDKAQYSWKSESSQLLRRAQLRLGSNLFHLGILGLFFGHLFGLLTPKEAYHALGLSTENKQLLAMVAGGVMGLMCLVGLLILLHRRWFDSRIRATTKRIDLLVQIWILITLLLGLSSIVTSAGHMDGGVMLQLSAWAKAIVLFQSGAASHITDVAWIFKTHLFMGMTLFILFPFSRLVHVWSGFAATGYLIRPYQIVRRR